MHGEAQYPVGTSLAQGGTRPPVVGNPKKQESTKGIVTDASTQHQHFHFHIDLSGVNHRLDNIVTLIKEQGFKIMAELDTLTAQVKANTDAEGSAIVLINGFTARLDAAIAAGNPAALTQLSADLKSSSDALAAAVVANTPAA